MQFENISWRVKGKLILPDLPCVMGILNITPDSFHAPSRVDRENVLGLAERMLKAGAAIIDIGGASSRPGAGTVSVDIELKRVIPAIEAIHLRFPDALISVDTTHAKVAEQAVDAGAGMVNDISSGSGDEAMLRTVAGLGVPYIAMHMQGTPATMQRAPHYKDVVAEVTRSLSQSANKAIEAGIADVIIDPGFGFGKNVEHNYALLRELDSLTALGFPVLVGVSRKRMINEVLGTAPEDALNGTTILNTMALLNGASILRVHDVKEATEAVKLFKAYNSQGTG